MKVFFKNVGVLFIFAGLVPFILMFDEGFDLDAVYIGLFFLVVGTTLFFINRE